MSIWFNGITARSAGASRSYYTGRAPHRLPQPADPLLLPRYAYDHLRISAGPSYGTISVITFPTQPFGIWI
jgi:hypothetical protein